MGIADNQVEVAIHTSRGPMVRFARLEKVGLPEIVSAKRVETQLTPDHVRLKRVADGQGQTESGQIDGISTHFDAKDLFPDD